MLGAMTETVKTRTYTSTRRRARALKNRRAIIEAANELFTTRGYRDTSVTEIAERAHVSVDTLYVAVGRKPQLLLAVHDLVLGEMELDEEARPLVADQRAYVKAVRAEATAAGKIRVYADALARVLPRTAPLMRALLEAAASDPDCRRVWDSVDQRRAANMRLLAADLRSTGELRPDLSDDEVADLIWSMNSPVYFSMLADRGWTAERYADLVADVWTRTLLTTGR
jgi:AcrR family transcriptional regulator